MRVIFIVAPFDVPMLRGATDNYLNNNCVVKRG